MPVCHDALNATAVSTDLLASVLLGVGYFLLRLSSKEPSQSCPGSMDSRFLIDDNEGEVGSGSDGEEEVVGEVQRSNEEL